MLFTALSYEDNYYTGATFPEVYLTYDFVESSLDFGLINPVYGYSAIPIADVFAKSRQFVGVRKSEDASTELRQGNLGLRFNTFLGDGELTLIYMPDVPSMHDFSNFGHRAYFNYGREVDRGSYNFFGLYQTRDNYDGPYTAILDVHCPECGDFNVPALRETQNLSFGTSFEYGIDDKLTLYGEALVSRNTSKFDIRQIRAITGVDQEADARAVVYERENKGPYLKFMIGGQHSFSATDLVRVEYIHDQNGLSESQKNEWLRLLDLSLTLRSDELYGDMRDFNHNFGTWSRNYAFWNYEKRLGKKADNVLSIGQYLSLDDNSFIAFAGYTHAISDSISFNLRGTFAPDGKFSDFGSIGERSSFGAFFEKSF